MQLGMKVTSEECNKEVRRIRKEVKEFVEELKKIQEENNLYYVSEVKCKRDSEKKNGRNVIIHDGKTLIVKEMIIDDNLGNSKSTNDKPPGEVEIEGREKSIKVKTL